MVKVANRLNLLLLVGFTLEADKVLSDGWYYHFMSIGRVSWPFQKGDPTVNVQMDYLNEEIMEERFNIIKFKNIQLFNTTSIMRLFCSE